MIEPRIACYESRKNMLTVVLILNLLISGLCWYGVWRVWQWRRFLAQVTQALTVAERNTDRVLQAAPAAFLQGQINSYQLRNQYQQALLQFQRGKRILALWGMCQFLWQQYTRQPAVGRSSKKNIRKPRVTYL